MGKYLDDKAIDNAEDDKFGHLNLAKQISEIIKEQSPDMPVNIGLFGKWGVGKSSVVELLEKDVLAKEIQNEELRFIRVNVWKYHSVNSIRNKIFYQIGKVLEVEDRVKKIYENSTTTTNNVDYKEFLKSFFEARFSKDKTENYTIATILFLMAIVLLYCMYKLSPEIGFVASSITSILVSGTFIKVGMDYFLKTFVSSTSVVSKPFESEEQFEHAVIDLFNEQKFKDMKKILFIDDLDRCSSDKVLMTLETIKTFLQISNCIFIVACDQDMVKKAVIDSNKDFKYSDKDGANYLEKFFQHFIYLPPYLPTNLRNFTKNIITESELSIATDLNVKQLDTVIYILAYRDIINPRKIKVLLNSFIFDYYTIKEKEGDERHPLQSGFITQYPERLAILTVLKIDFPLFVNDLTIDPTLASKIAYGGEGIDLKKFERKYFSQIAEDQQEYHDQLYAYLFLVKDWIPRDFTPYLFVSLETTDFNEFPTIEHTRYVRMIRDGNSNLMLEIENLEKAEQLKVCCAIGKLQESLNNSVERKNATSAFSEVAAKFPQMREYIHSPEILYSFKANFEQWFAAPEDYARLNESGLRNLIIYACNEGYFDQGKSLIQLITQNKTNGLGMLFFMITFITKDNYNLISSEQLKEEIQTMLGSLLDLNIRSDTYSSVVPDILGADIESAVFANNCDVLVNILAKITVGEFKTEEEKLAYDLKFYGTFISYLSKNQLDILIVNFLKKLWHLSPSLYKIYVVTHQEIFGQILLVSEHLCANKGNSDIEEMDEKYIEAILKICQTSMLKKTEDNSSDINKSIYPVIDYANNFLHIYDSEVINEAMIECYQIVLESVKLTREKKIEFIIDMIDSTRRVTRNEKNLTMLLGHALAEFRHINIVDKVSAKFAEAIKELKDIKVVEAFLKNYRSLIDPTNSNVNAQLVNDIFVLNTAESALYTADLQREMVSHLKKPVDLLYISKALADEPNIAYVDYCTRILSSENSFTKATNAHLLESLPKIVVKTTVKASDSKRYYTYLPIVRLRMIEILLLHTDFAVNINLLALLKSIFVEASGLRNDKARMIAAKKLVQENGVNNVPLSVQHDVLSAMSKIVKASNGAGLNLLLDYLTGMIVKIISDRRTTLKSELQSVFVILQTQFKSYSHTLGKDDKAKIFKIFSMSLDCNPKLDRKIDKLLKTFKL